MKKQTKQKEVQGTKFMTEQQFIAYFKRKGFALYKVNELNKKLRALVKINKLSKIIE